MILCCGEALIDMLPQTVDAGATAYLPQVGGAVFNTAIALGRLNVSVGLFTGISTDFFGHQLLHAMQESRVDSSRLVFSDRHTTLAFVGLTEGTAEYAFFDENSAGRMLRSKQLPRLTDDIEALFFGGISLVQEPCGSTYEELLVGASETRVVVLDPNIRPGFITDEVAYRARVKRLSAHADLVKLSDEDLQWLEGPGDYQSIATRILQRGPKIVIVTRGAAGATAITARHRIEVEAEQVSVCDTVGAGDTFNAGLLASLQHQGVLNKQQLAGLHAQKLQAALSWGIKAAAVTVSRAGANPPWLSEL